MDQKIEEQIEFVRWWRETVTPSRNRVPESENADLRFQKNDAEEFVRWWWETVSVRESPGRNGVKSNADQRSIPKDDAEEFVRWWRETVSANHGAGRGNKKNADLGSFSMDAAESLTGISQQQVSKWGKRLGDVEKYRATLLGAAYKASTLDIMSGVSTYQRTLEAIKINGKAARGEQRPALSLPMVREGYHRPVTPRRLRHGRSRRVNKPSHVRENPEGSRLKTSLSRYLLKLATSLPMVRKGRHRPVTPWRRWPG